MYQDLLDAINFTDVIPSMIGVFGSLAIVYVAWKGAQIILNSIRGYQQTNADYKEYLRESEKRRDPWYDL